ncbi:hypothetical protein C8R47DRAFT_1191121 [Mycena vitilis]|nr:hypothetical protein C8R47DRAFT_1191121 [Mycena vitilis]
MSHLSLISRIDDAIHAALPAVQPRLKFHLNNGGLATLLKSASDASVQDYRTVGEIAMNEHTLLHFLRADIPHKHRGVNLAFTITARILSPEILQLLIRQSNLKSDHFDALSADPADTLFIFVGALAASKGDVAQWFEETFVPMIDSAASEYTVYLEELPKLPVPKDGASPPKRMRHSNSKTKLARYSKAVDVLTSMAVSLSGKSTESGPDTDHLEELQVLTILNPAGLVEGLRFGPLRSATSPSLPATFNDDISEEQDVLTLLDHPSLGQDFGAVPSSAVSGILVSLAGAAQESVRWPRSAPRFSLLPDAKWWLSTRLRLVMAAKTLFYDFP